MKMQVNYASLDRWDVVLSEGARVVRINAPREMAVAIASAVSVAVLSGADADALLKALEAKTK